MSDTPYDRQRALGAIAAAANDLATLNAAVNSAPDLSAEEWRDVTRLARESRAEAQRAMNALHVAIRDARAREAVQP